MKKPMKTNSEIIIYENGDGTPQISVRVENETVWLDAYQMADLFKIDRSGIAKHIKNIYETGELEPKATCAKIAQVAKDGKKRQMDIYNLDVIISVGYRVNSIYGTHFRIWATKRLKNISSKALSWMTNDLNRQAAEIIGKSYSTVFVIFAAARRFCIGKY